MSTLREVGGGGAEVAKIVSNNLRVVLMSMVYCSSFSLRQKDYASSCSKPRLESLYSFIAVDTQHYGFLLEKLGISSTTQTSVIIADARNEQTLIMDHTFSR